MSLKRRIARLFFPYGSHRTVLRGPARGTRFVVQRGTGVMYALGGDDATPRHYTRLIRPGMTVLDVGANVGQSALLFSCLVGPAGRVVSFEPAPKPFEGLLANIAVSGYTNIEAHRLALSDTCGEAEFMFSDTGTTAGKLVDVEPTKGLANHYRLQVITATCDSLIEDGTIPVPDLIKIDVEGAGAAVLRGAAALLESAAPPVFIELHGPDERAGVRDELLGRGYVLETLGGERVADPTRAWKSPLWCYRPA